MLFYYYDTSFSEITVHVFFQILSPSLGQNETESKGVDHQRVTRQSSRAAATILLKPQISQLPQGLQGIVVTLENGPPPDFSKAELQSGKGP